MDNIVIIGSSGHARVIIDIIQQEGKYRIIGLIDRYRKIDEETLGYRVMGGEEDLSTLIKAHALEGVIVAIGDNFSRSIVAARIRGLCPDLPFVSAIHPKASVATNVSIGPGTVIMAGVCIGPCSSIGESCILNTGSSLDHDSVMLNFSSLAPRATTGGNCRIGEFSAIGIGATLIHGVNIGEHSVVGAASLVLGSVEPFVVAYGTPAKTVRRRRPGDKYL